MKRKNLTTEGHRVSQRGEGELSNNNLCVPPCPLWFIKIRELLFGGFAFYSVVCKIRREERVDGI